MDGERRQCALNPEKAEAFSLALFRQRISMLPEEMPCPQVLVTPARVQSAGYHRRESGNAPA